MSLQQFVTGFNILIYQKKISLHYGHEKPWIRIQSRIRICIDLECLIRIEVNMDPKHWLQPMTSIR